MIYQKDNDPPQRWGWYAISLGKSHWTTCYNPNHSFTTHSVQLIEVDEPDEEKLEGEVEEQIQGKKKKKMNLKKNVKRK